MPMPVHTNSAMPAASGSSSHRVSVPAVAPGLSGARMPHMVQMTARPPATTSAAAISSTVQRAPDDATPVALFADAVAAVTRSTARLTAQVTGTDGRGTVARIVTSETVSGLQLASRVGTVPHMREHSDVVVLGGGPAGLAAALAAARGGASVTLVEASDRVGGLCRTLEQDGCRLDLGGHIPFFHHPARIAWADELMERPIRWINRPVARVEHGRIVPGRYIDQMPDGPVTLVHDDGTAAGQLGSRVGAAFRDHIMRGYLEKVDGWPLEVISADRSRKLHDEQRAPDGFWYPEGGIGALMDAMATGVTAAGGRIRLNTQITGLLHSGGRVTGVEVAGSQPGVLEAKDLICAVSPAVMVAAAQPAAPDGLLVPVTHRAVTFVYLIGAREQLTEEAWIQVSDLRVPFSRIAEFRHWDPNMVPDGQTVLCAEIYGSTDDDDPWWSQSDAALALAVRDSLVDPLGWTDDASDFRLLRVVRMPAAYSMVEADRVDAVTHAPIWLGGLEGMHLARGGTVMTAIEAGEVVATRAALRAR